LGPNVELGLCVERMELREMLLLGPSSILLTLFSYLLALQGGSLCDPKHLNIVQHLKIQIQKYANFQPNPSEEDFLYNKADVLFNEAAS
jgi:hypothetical protein